MNSAPEISTLTGDDLGIEYMERLVSIIKESETGDSGLERFVNS